MDNVQKKSYSPEEIKNFISQWKQSGLNKKKFADQHGLKYCTFIAWFERHGNSSGGGFEEVKIKTSAEHIFAEILIGEKCIRFFQPFPAEYFQLLLK